MVEAVDPLNKKFPDIARGNGTCVDPEHGEIPGVGDHRLLPVSYCIQENVGKRFDRQGLLGSERRKSFLREELRRAGDRRGDREVGGGSLLRVNKADLDGVAVEPRNSATRIDPLVAENTVRIERGEVAIDGVENFFPGTLPW